MFININNFELFTFDSAVSRVSEGRWKILDLPLPVEEEIFESFQYFSRKKIPHSYILQFILYNQLFSEDRAKKNRVKNKATYSKNDHNFKKSCQMKKLNIFQKKKNRAKKVI